MTLPAAAASLCCRSNSRGRGKERHERLFDLPTSDESDYGKVKPRTKSKETRESRGRTPTKKMTPIRTGISKRKEEQEEEPLIQKEKTHAGKFDSLTVGTHDLTAEESVVGKGRNSQAKDERSFEELVAYYVDQIPGCVMLCWHRVSHGKGYVHVPARICAVKKVTSQAMIDDLGFLKGGSYRVVSTSDLVRYSGTSHKKRWCPKLMKEYLEFISRYDAADVQEEEAFLKKILQGVKAKEPEEPNSDEVSDDKYSTVEESRCKSFEVDKDTKMHEASAKKDARDEPPMHTVYREERRQEVESHVETIDADGLDSTAWWELSRTQLKMGATPLVNRCIREHGWSESFAIRVLEGYKQFMAWKQYFEDWDDTALYPSVPIKMMWQQHLLDSGNYQRDCRILFGNVMNYDPDGRLDSEAEANRVENTRRLAKMRYRGRDFDEQVWHWEENKPEKPVHHVFSLDIASSSSQSSYDSRSIEREESICLRILGGFKKGLRSASITMDTSDNFQSIFEEYATEYAVRAGNLVSLRFLTKEGRHIADTDTPKKLGFKDNDEILVVQMESDKASWI